MKNIIFVLCEGPHDVAFLYRLLATDGFKGYKEKIGDFPQPINKLILRALKESEYENLKLDEIRAKPLPQKVVFKENTLILLYAMGGDGKKEKRRELLEQLFDVHGENADEDADDFSEDLAYSLLYPTFRSCRGDFLLKIVDKITPNIV